MVGYWSIGKRKLHFWGCGAGPKRGAGGRSEGEEETRLKEGSNAIRSLKKSRETKWVEDMRL